MVKDPTQVSTHEVDVKESDGSLVEDDKLGTQNSQAYITSITVDKIDRGVFNISIGVEVSQNPEISHEVITEEKVKEKVLSAQEKHRLRFTKNSQIYNTLDPTRGPRSPQKPDVPVFVWDGNSWVSNPGNSSQKPTNGASFSAVEKTTRGNSSRIFIRGLKELGRLEIPIDSNAADGLAWSPYAARQGRESLRPNTIRQEQQLARSSCTPSSPQRKASLLPSSPSRNAEEFNEGVKSASPPYTSRQPPRLSPRLALQSNKSNKASPKKGTQSVATTLLAKPRSHSPPSFSRNVHIRGVEGLAAARVNGVYEPTEERSCGRPVYSKRGDSDTWLEYLVITPPVPLLQSPRLQQEEEIEQLTSKAEKFSVQLAHKQWDEARVEMAMKKLMEASDDNLRNYAGSPGGLFSPPDFPGPHDPRGPMDPSPPNSPRPSASQVSSPRSDGAYSTCNANSAGNKTTKTSSSNGLRNADLGRGKDSVMKTPRSEASPLTATFVLVSEKDRQRELSGAVRSWVVRSTADRGTSRAWAAMHSSDGRSPEKCTAAKWRVFDASAWQEQPNVKALAEAVSLRIKGAQGHHALAINGVFNPTDMLAGGMPVYAKRGDGNCWLEYTASAKKWRVKTSEQSNTGVASLRCDVAGGAPPNECFAAGTGPAQSLPGSSLQSPCWRVFDVCNWADQPSVQVVEELEAPTVLRISGALGPHADYVNGIYDVCVGLGEENREGERGDSASGLGVVQIAGEAVYPHSYRRRGREVDVRIEYVAAINCWQVKPAAECASSRGWAALPCEPGSGGGGSSGGGGGDYSGPVTCGGRVWYVHDGTDWAAQPSLSVTSVREAV